MDKEMRQFVKLVAGLISGLLVLAVVVGLISAKMESDTYNKLTGAHTTWWDAMWVELRVMDTPRKTDK